MLYDGQMLLTWLVFHPGKLEREGEEGVCGDRRRRKSSTGQFPSHVHEIYQRAKEKCS